MSIACSCKKIEFVGVQCGRAIKVLDVRNIKELPERYFLKIWRINAKSSAGTANDSNSKSAAPASVHVPISLDSNHQGYQR